MTDRIVLARGEDVCAHVIYGLIDPAEPNRIRYVGKATNPAARLAQHLSVHPGLMGPSAVYSWTAAIERGGRLPHMVLLERTEPGAIGRELHWFTALRAKGEADLNVREPKNVCDFQRNPAMPPEEAPC